jgi:hypothetical protein
LVRGPSVGAASGYPEPDVFLDGDGDPAVVLELDGSGVQVYMTDIKLQNVTGTETGVGLLADHGCVFQCENVHAEDCEWGGIVCFETTFYRVSGGVMTNCRIGCENNASRGTWGASGIGTKFIDCYQTGVHQSRAGQGHIDLCVFEDCARGITLAENSRAHIYSCNFKRSTVAAITANTGGCWYEDGNTYNEGTADANAVKWVNFAYSGQQYDSAGSGAKDFLGKAHSEMRIVFDDTGYSFAPGNTNKGTIASTVWTIPAYWFEDKSKKIRIRVTGQLPTTASTNIGIDFGGTQIDLSPIPGAQAANNPFHYEIEVWPRLSGGNYSSTQRMQSRFGSSNSNTRVLRSASLTADTSTALAVHITGQLVNGADTLTVDTIEVWITG